MDRLDRRSLKNILDTESGLAVTVYIPMHTTASPPHISENQIRYKNLLHMAAGEVRTREGSSSQLARELEQKVDKIYDDLEFWESQTPGLLVCATAGNTQMFHLPIDTEEYVAVDEHFHLAPVMGLMHDEHDFYVLVLAQHGPRLYKGDMYGLQPDDIELPVGVKEALNIDEQNQKTENQGTATPSGNGGLFNGRGGAKNPQGENRLRFFRMVDKAIYDHADRSLPLILAGTESDIAEYRHISKYPHILQGTMPGNHTHDDVRPLFEAAGNIIWREVVMPEHKSAIEEYKRVSGANPDRVAHDTKSIAEAASQGRIDKLLARLSLQTSDTVRDRADEVPRITFPEGEDSKQLNDIALTVWQSSGKVYNLQPDEMPDGQLMAARLRY